MGRAAGLVGEFISHWIFLLFRCWKYSPGGAVHNWPRCATWKLPNTLIRLQFDTVRSCPQSVLHGNCHTPRLGCSLTLCALDNKVCYMQTAIHLNYVAASHCMLLSTKCATWKLPYTLIRLQFDTVCSWQQSVLHGNCHTPWLGCSLTLCALFNKVCDMETARKEKASDKGESVAYRDCTCSR